MKTKPKLIKLADIEYNETLTIALVAKDEQLRSIFADELRLPFSLLITLSKEDKIPMKIPKLYYAVFLMMLLLHNPS